MFRSKKPKIKYVGIGDIKDWRDAGPEIEHLGTRLDQARAALAEAKSKWAKDYWSITANRLYTKWIRTVQLKDTGLKQQGPNSFYSKIDYFWWEQSEEVAMGIPLFDNLGRMMMDAVGNSNLERSWEKARDEKLQKARQGLA
jgi:hypothetical protein